MLRGAAVVALASSILQSQPPAPTIRTRADLVQVDAVVVDAKGRHVRGLAPADFVLRDRGKPQVIASFDEISHVRPVVRDAPVTASAPRDVATNQISSADRLVVMLVDDLHIYKERTDRAKEIAARVVSEFGPSASMAVLFTSGDHSTRITQDVMVLRAAVETLRGRQSWRRPNAAVDQQRSARIDAEMSAAQQLAIVSRAQEASLQQFFDNLTQYKLLQDAARLLRTTEARRKAFVLVSEGIGKDLTGVFDGMVSPCEARCPMCPCYHEQALIDMMESLRRSSIATYAIDPRGKVESKDLVRECFPALRTAVDPCSEGLSDWASVVRQAQRGLEIMTEATGGFAVTNTDDFTGGLGRIAEDLDHYYLLGFYPADASGNGYRPLDVAVPSHPDWNIRFRRGYMGGNEARGSKDPAASKELFALASGILPRTDLPLRLGATLLPGPKSASRVALVLEVSVPRADVEEPDGRIRDTLKYELLVVDEKKKRVRSLGGREGRLTLSVTALGRTPPAIVRYQISETVDLAPGQYEIRWSATSAKVGKGGSVYLPLAVPDGRGDAPILGGVAIGYMDGARVPIAPVTERIAQRGARVVTPSAPPARDLPFAATLDREFTTADTLRVYGEGTVRSGVRPIVSVDVVDGTGRVVRSPSPSFTVAESVRIQGDVPLAGLPPGPYVLRVTLTADPGRAAVRELAFTVIDPAR